jgi:hypothetical protein
LCAMNAAGLLDFFVFVFVSLFVHLATYVSIAHVSSSVHCNTAKTAYNIKINIRQHNVA